MSTSTQRTVQRTVGELTGSREVGQEFQSIQNNLSGVAFQIATYGGRSNIHDVVFELREHPDDTTPLVQTTVSASVFGDHQFFTFSFSPLSNSAGKIYYASLRSPSSETGNAITLDYSNDDPYQKGIGSSMVILLRNADGSARMEDAIKTHADLAFVIYHHVPLSTFLRVSLSSSLRELRASIFHNPGSYIQSLLFLFFAVVLSFSLVATNRFRSFTQSRAHLLSALVLLVVCTSYFHFLFLREMPYTNDEGTYLYDARTMLEGHLPGGDVLAKSPILMFAFIGGIGLLGHGMMVGRIVSSVFGILTAYPLYSIGRHIGGKRTGFFAAILWLCASAPTLFSIYGHTQTVQMFFCAWALAALLLGLQKNSLRLLFVSGLLIGVALVARKSSLALGVPVGLFLLLEPSTWRERIRFIGIVTAGVFVPLFLFFLGIYALYGNIGVRYATGFDLAQASVDQLTDRGDGYLTYSVKGVLPFFRECLPLIFLTLAALGYGIEKGLRRFGILAAKAGWLIPLLLAWEGGRFLQRYEEEIHFSYGMWSWWIVLEWSIVLLAFLPRPKTWLLFPGKAWIAVAWFVSVGVFYAFWIKFTANYLMEFLPALVLCAAVGATILSFHIRHRLPALLLFFFCLWGAYTATESSFHFSHTGTFHWSALQEAADFVHDHVPQNDLILTGAMMVPYMSGHHVPYNVGHPTWYGYGYIEPPLRNIFMASTEKLQDTVLHTVRWVVKERLTEFSYFNEYPAIDDLVNIQFHEVASIENLSNTITIYERNASPGQPAK